MILKENLPLVKDFLFKKFKRIIQKIASNCSEISFYSAFFYKKKFFKLKEIFLCLLKNTFFHS